MGYGIVSPNTTERLKGATVTPTEPTAERTVKRAGAFGHQKFDISFLVRTFWV